MIGKMRPEGDMTQGLLDLIATLPKNKAMIEIGCHTGESTKMFLDGLKPEWMFCIDIWEGGYDKFDILSMDPSPEYERIFDETIKPYSHVSKFKMPSSEAYKMFRNDSIDIVYIDANHQYEFVKADIVNFMPKLRDGGWLCGHDYSHDSVRQALNDLEIFPETFVDSSWRWQVWK